MPDAQGRPFARDIAARIGISTSDWRARVARQLAPEPVDRVEAGGVLHGVWDPRAIDAYVEGRQIRIGPAAARQRVIDCPHDDCDASTTSWAALNAHIRTDHAPERSAS